MSDWNKIFSSGFCRPRPTTYLIIKGIKIIDLANHTTLRERGNMMSFYFAWCILLMFSFMLHRRCVYNIDSLSLYIYRLYIDHYRARKLHIDWHHYGGNFETFLYPHVCNDNPIHACTQMQRLTPCLSHALCLLHLCYIQQSTGISIINLWFKQACLFSDKSLI